VNGYVGSRCFDVACNILFLGPAELNITVWPTLVSETSVPLTVKLSERFYQKFGHELVDELVEWFNMVDATYRGDLRELNELNFARFDAKLEQRLAESTAALRTEFLTALADQRSDLIKWMFIFWVGNVTTTAGLVFALAHILRS